MGRDNIAKESEWSEADLQKHVIELAELRGWRVYHARPAQTGKGWRTPVGSDTSVGFPDLVAARGKKVMWRELKSDTGRLTPGQEIWRDVLVGAGEDWAVWRPSMLDQILEVLR